jgi:hypothetical protein
VVLVAALLQALTALLPARLQPFAKAVYPALIALVAVVVQIASSGSIDGPALSTAVGGLVLTVVTFLVPNQSAADKK